jgi:hypothetical protein
MGRHTVLAVPAIKAVASSVNLANDTLADQALVAFLRKRTIDFFYYADELVARNALKSQIAARDLDIGVADTGYRDADEGFTGHRRRLREVTIKAEGVVGVD